MATTTKLLRQGKSKQELFPLLTSLDDKIHYNLAWYHIFSKDGADFLCYKALYRVCLLLIKDPKHRIKLSQEVVDRFKIKYFEFRDLDYYKEYQDGVMCNRGLISWQVWGTRKDQLLEKLEDMAAEIEIVILDGINQIKLKEFKDQIEKVYGGTIGTYEEHLEEGLLDEE